MRADTHLRSRTLVIALTAHSLLCADYLLSDRAAQAELPAWQFPALLAGLTLVSVFLVLCNEPYVCVSFLVGKLGLLGVSSPMHLGHLSIDIIVLAVILVETIFLLQRYSNYAIAGLLAMMYLVHRFYLGADVALDRSEYLAGVVMSMAALVLTGIGAAYLRTLFDRVRGLGEELRRLDGAVSQLTSANIGFQRYARDVEIRSIDEERKRITREIHDTTGYAFVNINMLIGGALSVDRVDPQEMRQLLELAREQAQRALSETRVALRDLRKIDAQATRGLTAIRRLADAFERATGVRVLVEFGNVTGFSDLRHDETIYSFVQEGITNAFRHGRATRIKVLFWDSGDCLTVHVWDNGIGCPQPVDGIGLSGMKERVHELHGTMSAMNTDDGFEVCMRIPLAIGASGYVGAAP